MLRSSGIWWRTPTTAKRLAANHPELRFNRHFTRSATNITSNGRPSYQQPPVPSLTSCRPKTFRPQLISLHPSSRRFQSTTPDVPVLTVNVASTSPPILEETLSLSSLDAATQLSIGDVAAIPEQIGYLKALGLDFGWGPTATMEWALEHVHVLTGTPWWLSIAITAFALRALLFKTYVGAADVSARSAALKPITQPILDKARASHQAGDQQAMLKARTELASIYKRADIQSWKAFIPLLQLPLGYGSFRLLRNMAALPVPGLESGGCLWFQDLTVADPFYVMPFLTGFILYRTMKAGGETGVTLVSPSMMKFFTYGLPVITTVFTMNFPAALQFSFLVSGSIAMAQSALFRNRSFRNWLGIAPLVTINPSSPETSAAASSPYSGKLKLAPTYKSSISSSNVDPSAPEKMPKPEGIIDGAIAEVRGMGVEMQKSWQNLRGTAEKQRHDSRSEKEKREANAYEKKRQRELERQRREQEQIRQERWLERQERGDTQKRL